MRSPSEVEADIIALSRERDEAIAGFNARAEELNQAYSAALADAKVATMTDTERAAVAAAIERTQSQEAEAQTIEPVGVESEINTGEPVPEETN